MSAQKRPLPADLTDHMPRLSSLSEPNIPTDMEKQAQQAQQSKHDAELESDLDSKASILSNSITRKLLKYGVEENGVYPIAVAERTDTKYIKVATLWAAMNVGIIPSACHRVRKVEKLTFRLAPYRSHHVVSRRASWAPVC